MSGGGGFELKGSGADPLEEGDPSRIGPIPLIGRLGAGGMGRVYLGVHEGRYAAVKQVRPSVAAEDKGFLRRFGHELDNLSRLPAEATAPLLASDRDAQPPWFATAYVPGITLSDAVERHGTLPVDALWLLLREAAAALALVHEREMVHRDIKPSNVMLTPEGLTLIDFGVARAADQSRLTLSGMMVGTPSYMSPEQATGTRASSSAVDIFALGSVIAYAATGTPPFGEGSGPPVLYRIVHEAPDIDALRELDTELADVVACCLDKDYEGRPTAAELVRLADRHGPFTPPLWPEAITGELAERAAFAARGAPETTAPTTPGPSAPKPVPGPGPGPVAAPKPEAGKSGRQRSRVRLVVIPVVVVVTGTTLAFQLLPYAFDPGDDRARPRASASATVSAGPSRSAAGAGSSPSARASGEDSTGGQAPASPGDADRAAAGKPEGKGKGDAGAQTGGGDGQTDGNPGGGDAEAGGGQDAGEVPASGTFTLKNAANGKCLAAHYSDAPYDGSCEGAGATWSYQSLPGGGFRIVSGRSGKCLQAQTLGHQVLAFNCGGRNGQEWREGPGGTLKNTATGGCLTVSPVSGYSVTTETCDGSAAQRWTRG